MFVYCIIIIYGQLQESRCVKNIKRLKPQLLDGDTHLNTKVYNDRIQRQELTRKRKGLNTYPDPLPEEEILIQGFATVLNQATENIIIQHPLCPIRLVLNKTIGARLGYLISCGDYVQQSLEMIQAYIHNNDTVLDIGAGFGLTTVLSAQYSHNEVVAVEPNDKLHPIIKKNATLNNIQVKIIHACVTSENLNGPTHMHIMDNTSYSSIFKHKENIDKSIMVNSLPFQHLIDMVKPSVIVMDAVGAEMSTFHNVKLNSVNKIILTINTPIIGEKSTAAIINSLIKKGFNISDIKGLVFYFNR